VANRRRISSAFRRPFRFGRKARTSWVSDIFASEALSLNRIDVNSLQLISVADWEATNALISKHIMLKRVVANLGCEFRCVAQESFEESFGFSLLWMLWVVDVDDLDTASIKTAVKGSAIQSARVLQTGVATFFQVPEPDSGAARGGAVWRVPEISIDWRGSAKLGQDDQVLWTMSETHTSARADDTIDSLVSLSVSGFTRCLVKGA